MTWGANPRPAKKNSRGKNRGTIPQKKKKKNEKPGGRPKEKTGHGLADKQKNSIEMK